MADMTALQRIIGGQARAHEALRREDAVRERERRSFITQTFLGAGVDPATVPEDQVDSLFQTILGSKVDAANAREQERVQKAQDIATRQAEEDQRRLEADERRKVADQRTILSLLRGIKDPQVAQYRTTIFGQLTGIPIDPDEAESDAPEIGDMVGRFVTRGNIAHALGALGYSEEDINDHRSPMYNANLSKTEGRLSDWLSTQLELAGIKDPSASMTRSITREGLNLFKPPVQPPWYDFTASKVPPNPVGSSFSGGPKPSYSSSGGLSIRQSDYEAGTASDAPELPATGESLINAVPPESRPTAGVILREAQTPLMGAIMMGIADQESAMGRYLVNQSGSRARGLFQIMPDTFKRIANSEGSSLSQFKDASREDIMRELESNHEINARAARELLYLNMRGLPDNPWAGIAAHHLGLPDLRKAYKEVGLNIKQDHPMLVAEAVAESTNPKYREFAGWFPNVYKNILKYRSQLGTE